MLPTRRNSFPHGGNSTPTRIANLALRQTLASASPNPSPHTDHNTQRLSSLACQAKELGDMTRALHIRSLQRQVQEIEKQIVQLCQRTEDDQAYREKNEARLSELFREVVAVKTQAEQIKDQPVVSQKDLEKTTEGLVAKFRTEMGELRRIVGEAQELSAQLRDPDDILHLMAPSPEPQDKPNRRFDQNESQQRSVTETGINPDIERRIKEAIASTSRWHKQHKTTPLGDPEFIKNYLEKQATRDMRMAQIVQRALARLLARRGLAPASRSLADFCTNLTWEDVTSTFKKLLGEQRKDTARKLARKRE